MATGQFIARAREHEHSKECLTKATISVVENWRDDKSVGGHDFHLCMQDGVIWDTVLEYLHTASTLCYCEPCDGFCCTEILDTKGR